MRLAAHLDDAGKMPLTDFCNRHTTRAPNSIVRFSSPQLAPQRPPPHRASNEVLPSPDICESTASDHLAAIRPRAERRFDDALQLQPQSLTVLLFRKRKNMGRRFVRRPLRRGVLNRAGSRRLKPLTLPVAPRASPGQARRARRAKTASTTPASTGAAFPAESAFHRQVLHPHSQAAPATDLAALPPRSGFQRSFAPPMLSHEEARPSTIARVIHPGSRGPRAACRLLQSITINEHNYRIDQTPLTDNQSRLWKQLR